MLIRDRTLNRTEYKGRWTDARDGQCPCRPCFNAHNCQRDPERYYSHPDMRCATRENGGCPQPIPEAIHVYRVMGKVCRRCGHRGR